MIDSKYLDVLKEGYELLCTHQEVIESPLPVNVLNEKGELLRRNLDCAVIQTIHKNLGKQEYDSVRGVFFEGNELYEKAGKIIQMNQKISL